MIRPNFLTASDRLELLSCVKRPREDHGVARRAACECAFASEYWDAMCPNSEGSVSGRRHGASQTWLNDVANLMNNRPRKTLGWRTPAEALADEIAAFKSTVALDV